MGKTIIETAQPFRMFHNERDSKKIQRPPQLLALIPTFEIDPLLSI